MSLATEMNLRSYSKLYQRTINWTIDNVSKLPDEWMEKTPEFTIEPQSKWHIVFKKNLTTFYLLLCWNNEKRFRNSFKALALSSNKEVLWIHEESCTDTEIDILPSSFHKDVIEKLSDDQIIFTVSFEVWFFQSDVIQISKVPEIQQDHLLKLQGDLKNIYANNIKPDVTFHVQGETVSAHKAVLMARSEVFAKMFQAGLKEEQTDTVDIEDISMAAMKALLLFMYSAEVTDLDLDTGLEVYAAADKYGVMDLKDVCRRVITSKVTIESATKVLVFAEARDDVILRDNIMQYIVLHYRSTENEVHTKS